MAKNKADLVSYELLGLREARQAGDMLMINNISFYLAVNPAESTYSILVPPDLKATNPGIFNRLMCLVKKEKEGD